MKQTAMQDLREDLQLTVETAKDALLEIENQEIREACQEVVRLTLKNIIKRIDEELLEMEEQQIIDAYVDGNYDNGMGRREEKEYYNEKFKNNKIMKNIHVIPTDKPSRLHLESNGLKLSRLQHTLVAQNIYITNDEEIKEGWILVNGFILRQVDYIDGYMVIDTTGGKHHNSVCVKIILTTDQDLIKDGIQAIDDEFLEWFVKNPSCEEIKTYYIPNEYRYNFLEHKIIIPQFGTKEFNDLANQYFGGKQETLEEVAERHTYGNAYQNFIRGAKWQQERSYSLDEIKTAMKNGYGIKYFSEHTFLKNLNNLKKK
jgi:hypothetical protein